jgi:hypothetical protein
MTNEERKTERYGERREKEREKMANKRFPFAAVFTFTHGPYSAGCPAYQQVSLLNGSDDKGNSPESKWKRGKRKERLKSNLCSDL